MTLLRHVLTCFFWICLSLFAHAETTLSETQTKRAKALFDIVRCPVCDGQVLSGSDATIAVDLKKRIQSDIASGKSDYEIMENLKHIYGDDILQSPPVDWRTYMLWYGPYGIIILLFIIWLTKHISKRKNNT